MLLPNQWTLLRGLVVFGFLFGFASSAFAVENRSGERIYRLCQNCHGDKGQGKTSLEAPAIAGLPSWYVERQLKKFKNGVRGKHPRDIAGFRMRPMAKTLRSEEEIKAVSEYVGELEPVYPEKTMKLGDQDAFLKGEQKYQVCKSCHGPKAKGKKALNAPPLIHQSDWYLVKQLRHFKQGVRAGDPSKDVTGAAMVPMAKQLDKEGMRQVVAFIYALR